MSLEGADASDFQVISDDCLSVPLVLMVRRRARSARGTLDQWQPHRAAGHRRRLRGEDGRAAGGRHRTVRRTRGHHVIRIPQPETNHGKGLKIGKSVTVSFHLAADGRADELETPTLQIAPGNRLRSR